MSAWNTDQIPDQAGRRVVVTGASSGLGEITAYELTRKGARVVLAVRCFPWTRTAFRRSPARTRTRSWMPLRGPIWLVSSRSR